MLWLLQHSSAGIVPQMKLQLVFLNEWNKAMGDSARALFIDCSRPIPAFKTEFRLDRDEQNRDLIDLLLSEGNNPQFSS